MAKALIVVDVQNDFCEGGTLPVTGGAAVAAAISEHMAKHRYDHIVATRDYHIDPGTHFSDHPDYVNSWPVHCVAGTPGSSFHPELDVTPLDAVFSKGNYAPAYSGFEGAARTGEKLENWLRDREVSHVDVVGIATDYCVRATALDAKTHGFHTTVLLGCTAAVAEETAQKAIQDLKKAGVTLVGKPIQV